MDVESEIRDLKRRVGELEGTYGFLTGQVRDVHRAVLGFQEANTEELGEIKSDLSQFRSKVERFEARTEQQLDALPRALAEIVRAEFERRDRKG
jgi:predicted  nucleic acid-binding Zn-ribbon protein